MRPSPTTSTRTRSAHVALLAAALAGCGSEEWQLDGGDLTALGREYVAARGCATCHQGEEGTLAGQRDPRPGTSAWGANLTPDIDTGLGAWADIQIVRAMRYGVDDE